MFRRAFASVRTFPDEQQRATAQEIAREYPVSHAGALVWLRHAEDVCEAWGLEGEEHRTAALDLLHTSARLCRALAISPEEAIQRIRAQA